MADYRKWTTVDGRSIPLAEMAVSHIENCIAHLRHEVERCADDIALSQSFGDAEFCAAILGAGTAPKESAIKEASRWIDEFNDELRNRAVQALERARA